MSPDEQEAESRKYVAAIVVPLSSGNFGLFSPRCQRIGIFSEGELCAAIRTLDLDSFSARNEKPRLKPSLDLDDLLASIKIGP